MMVIVNQVLCFCGLQIECFIDICVKVVIEFLECGYGYMLGNVLCCVLLLFILGFVIMEVEIDGVLYEYIMFEGLQEDVLEVLFNLKDVVICMYIGDSVMLLLFKQGLGVVIVVDIKVDYNVEIFNNDYIICYLIKDMVINMCLKIECGFGYQLVVVCCCLDEEICVIGCLVLDVLFLLVCCVVYLVEVVCVEQCIDLDKLVLDIEINGMIDVEEVVCIVVDIFSDQLLVFGDFIYCDCGVVKLVNNGVDLVLLCLIDDLELIVCLVNCLKVESIYYIGDLIQKIEVELFKILNFGKKLLIEIKEVFVQCGFLFGMKLENWLLVGVVQYGMFG